jgi:hypothetical protein
MLNMSTRASGLRAIKRRSISMPLTPGSVQLQRFAHRGCLPHDAQSIITLEQATIAFAHYRMIVNQQHGDPTRRRTAHGRRLVIGARATGNDAITSKPSPRLLASFSEPPNAATRSRMPTSPKPVRGAAMSAPPPLSPIETSTNS